LCPMAGEGGGIISSEPKVYLQLLASWLLEYS
jgi:hypothetical protein